MFPEHLQDRNLATVDEIVCLFDGKLGRSAIYESVRRGDFPVEVVRIGRRVLVPVKPLLAALGIESANGTGAVANEGARSE